MSRLNDLNAAIARCDRLDWRIEYDADAEEWAAWFHPDWDADPQRVIRLVLADNLIRNLLLTEKRTAMAIGKSPLSKGYCGYSGKVLSDCYRKWHGELIPEECPRCGAKRKPQVVQRNLGGPRSGCYEDWLIYPYHRPVKRRA